MSTFFKALLLSFLLSVPVFSFSQPSEKIADNIRQNVCVLLITFKGKHGTIKQHGGYGFIINNRYLVTVAHLFSPFYDTLHVSNILVRYFDVNNRNDSVYVNLNYKYSKNQFDFYSHPYDTSKSETDFLILKLKHDVKAKPVKFSTDPLNIMQPLYSAGFESNKKNPLVSNFSIDETFFLFNAIENLKNNFRFVVGIGYAQHGSSGSPFLNDKGEIIGIIQSGWDTIPIDYLNKLTEEGVINPADKDVILQFYKKGLRISFALGIDYIQHHYLKGFL